jgi:hypothetical protein
MINPNCFMDETWGGILAPKWCEEPFAPPLFCYSALGECRSPQPPQPRGLVCFPFFGEDGSGLKNSAGFT